MPFKYERSVLEANINIPLLNAIIAFVLDTYAYLSSRSELLELISRLSLEQFPRLPHHPDYLVLGRRHAVCLAGIMDAGVGCGYDWMNGEQM